MKKEIEKLDKALTDFVEKLDAHFTRSKAKTGEMVVAASELKNIKQSLEIVAKIAVKYRAPKEDLYYIQNGYIGNAVAWWGIKSAGYTPNIEKACRYTKNEALDIIKNRVEDVAWKCSYIDNHPEALKLIVDAQYLDAKGNKIQGRKK